MQGFVPLVEQIVVRGGVELVDDDLPSVKARLSPRAHVMWQPATQAGRQAVRQCGTPQRHGIGNERGTREACSTHTAVAHGNSKSSSAERQVSGELWAAHFLQQPSIFATMLHRRFEEHDDLPAHNMQQTCRMSNMPHDRAPCSVPLSTASMGGRA
jgi:hypothetical protein